jgi:GDPmannose 4,6-dehydratase
LKKNLFITGGSGQDGIILNKLFKYNKKYNLFNIVDKKKKIKNHNTLVINLLNKEKIDNLFKSKNPDIVLHLGSKNPSFFEKSYKIFYKNNLKCAENLFYSTFEHNNNAKFFFCNSSQIFKKKYGKVNEKSLMRETSDYTRFRIIAHKQMLKYKKKKKINYTNIILFNHDSIFRNKKFILPRIIIALSKKNYSYIQKIINSNISADFSHAVDICEGIKKIILSPKNLDNIILSSNRITKINDIIKYIIRKNQIKNNLKFNSKVKSESLFGDNSFAKKIINWKPKKNIFLAAKEMYEFYNK